MTKKKTAAVVAVAFGLTATATGSYATTSSGGSEDAARTTAQHSAVKVDKLRTNVAKSTDAQSERRRCVGKKKMRRIRVFMTQRRVMRILPRPTRKDRSGSLKFRYFNACTSSLNTDFEVIFKKHGRKGHRKWKAYDVSVFWS